MSARLATLGQLGLNPIFIRHRQLDRFANHAIELEQSYMAICIQFFNLLILQSFNSSILLHLSHHVRTPEVGYAIAINVVGALITIAVLTDKIDYLQGSLVGQ